MAVKCGAEIIVHATKQTFQKLLNNERVDLLQIDFKNVFNFLTRSGVLDAAQTFIPALAPFASFCYSQHRELFFNATQIESQLGVQQGDSLGRLLFSFALWPVINELNNKLPNLMLFSWYRDDGIITGTEEELCESLESVALNSEETSASCGSRRVLMLLIAG